MIKRLSPTSFKSRGEASGSAQKAGSQHCPCDFPRILETELPAAAAPSHAGRAPGGGCGRLGPGRRGGPEASRRRPGCAPCVGHMLLPLCVRGLVSSRVSACACASAPLSARISGPVRPCDARLASSPFSSCISLHPSHPSLCVSKILLTDMKTRPRENLCTNAHNDPMHGSQDVQTDMSVGRRRGRRSADGRSAPPQHQRPSHVVGRPSDACHHRPRAAGFQSRALSRMGESRRGKAGRRSRGVRAEPER